MIINTNICIMIHKGILRSIDLFFIYSHGRRLTSLGVNARQTLNCKWIIFCKLRREFGENSLFYQELYLCGIIWKYKLKIIDSERGEYSGNHQDIALVYDSTATLHFQSQQFFYNTQFKKKCWISTHRVTTAISR